MDLGSSSRMNPAGIASSKTGVGGNSTAGDDDMTEIGREKALDARVTEDPNKFRLSCDDELMLLVPSV
jgi:hypothetical protein